MDTKSRVVNADEEMAKCRESCAYFVQHYAWYTETRGTSKGLQKFIPWDWQLALVHNWQHGVDGKNRHVILKARQLGVSWLVSFYALWLALFHPGSNVLLLSYKEMAAKMLIRRMKDTFSKIPKWLIPGVEPNRSTQVIEFFLDGADNAFSRVESLASTEDAGRGEATSLAVLDEWAMHPYDTENFAAISDSLGIEGQIIGLSTAKGAAGTFYNIFRSAHGKQNDFVPWFIPWSSHPDRTADPEWYATMLKNKISAGGPELGKRDMAQEFPRTWEEAFVASGAQVFDASIIMAMMKEAAKHRPLVMTQELREWQEPIMGREYIIGVDCSEGLADGDYGAAIVRDWRTGVHVATLRGRWEPRVFAAKIAALGWRWNSAFIGVERNGTGLAVLEALTDVGYSNLYYELRVSGTSGENVSVKEGWVTNKSTKPVMISTMQEALATGAMVSYDETLLGEYLTYVREETREQDVKVSNKTGRTGARRGAFDDCLIADLICWQMRDYFEHGNQNIADPYYSESVPREDLDYLDSVRSGSRRMSLLKKYGKQLPDRLQI